MYHLIIDTCVWIDLCRKFVEVRKKISDLVKQKKVRLILPQIVIDEWNKNKEFRIITPKKEAIRTRIKHAKEISHHLKKNEAKKLEKILNGYEERKEEIESLILKEIKAVENLFNHTSTIRPSITESTKSQAIDFALAKKAPFKNKNSMADALILFSSIDYVKQEGVVNCLFVSSNTEDFSSSNRLQIHEDLKEIFDECGMRYFANIGQAINEIEANLIKDKDIKIIEKTLQFEAMQRALENYYQQVAENIKSMGDLSVEQQKIMIDGYREWIKHLMKALDHYKPTGDISAIEDKIIYEMERPVRLMDKMLNKNKNIGSNEEFQDRSDDQTEEDDSEE